jgi:hypothetical protein
MQTLTCLSQQDITAYTFLCVIGGLGLGLIAAFLSEHYRSPSRR